MISMADILNSDENDIADSHLHTGGFRFSESFNCPFPGCSKTFTRKENIKYHLKTHQQHRDRPFSCGQCNKSYFKLIDLTRHIRSTHYKLTPFKCELCQKSYTRKETLKVHMKKMHPTYTSSLIDALWCSGFEAVDKSLVEG